MTRWRRRVTRVFAANSAARRDVGGSEGGRGDVARLHGSAPDLRRDLGGAEGRVDALAREGIEEAGGVPDQDDAVLARRDHAVGERPQGADRPDGGGRRGVAREIRGARVSRGRSSLRGPPCVACASSSGITRLRFPTPARDRIQDRVGGRREDDLASLGVAARALHVGDEREPVEPAMRSPEPEPLDDDRRPAVGGDDQPGREGALPGRSGAPGSVGSATTPVTRPAVAEEVDHAHPFADRDARLPGALDERQVERPAAHGEGVRSMAVPRSVGRVVADQQGAVGREDPHPPERPRPARLHPGEHAEAAPGSGSPPARGTRRRSCRGESARGRGGRRRAPARRGGSRSRRRPDPRRRRPRQPACAASDAGRVQTPDLAEGGGTMPADVREPGAPGQVRELRRRVRSPHREGPVVPCHPVSGHRVGDEPDGRPRESASPEVAHDEAEPRQLGEPAEHPDDGVLGQMMEDQRAERHVDRARPDGRIERVARDDVDLRGAVRGSRRVSQDRRVDVQGHDPHPVAAGAAPTARAPAECPPPRFPRRGRGGSRRPRAARGTARRAAGWSARRRSGSVGRCRRGSGSARRETRRAGPSARGARLREAAGRARAPRTGAARLRRRSRGRARP